MSGSHRTSCLLRCLLMVRTLCWNVDVKANLIFSAAHCIECSQTGAENTGICHSSSRLCSLGSINPSKIKRSTGLLLLNCNLVVPRCSIAKLHWCSGISPDVFDVCESLIYGRLVHRRWVEASVLLQRYQSFSALRGQIWAGVHQGRPFPRACSLTKHPIRIICVLRQILSLIYKLIWLKLGLQQIPLLHVSITGEHTKLLQVLIILIKIIFIISTSSTLFELQRIALTQIC